MTCYERALQCNPELKVARTNLAARPPPGPEHSPSLSSSLHAPSGIH